MNKATVAQKLGKVVRTIVEKFQPERVILFGSYAWGEPGPDSDIDLLVIGQSKKQRIERERSVREALFPAGIPLDVLMYTPDELEKSINIHRNLFLEDIVRNGQVLYSKPGFEIKLGSEVAEIVRL